MLTVYEFKKQELLLDPSFKLHCLVLAFFHNYSNIGDSRQ